MALLASACGGDDEPELTIEEQLDQIEGRPLRPAEIEERLSVGATLCQMSDPVLDAIWFKLDDDQLEFQDLVFGRLCPERSVFYAGKTGRYVTEEATESGVVTSTSRPPSTTTTTTTAATSSTTATTTALTGTTSEAGSSAGSSSGGSSSTDTASRSGTARTATSTTPLSTETTRVGEGG